MHTILTEYTNYCHKGGIRRCEMIFIIVRVNYYIIQN